MLLVSVGCVEREDKNEVLVEDREYSYMVSIGCVDHVDKL